MDANEIKGSLKSFAGRAEEGVGAITGDVKLKLEGKVDQLAGKAQEKFGGAVDAVKSRLEEGAREVSRQSAAVVDAVSETRESARKVLDALAALAARKVQERPVLAVAGAVAAGVLLSYLLASSSKKDRYGYRT